MWRSTRISLIILMFHVTVSEAWKDTPLKGNLRLETHKVSILLYASCTGKEKRIQQCQSFQTKLVTNCRIHQVFCNGKTKESPVSIDCKENKFKLSIKAVAFRRYFPDVDSDKITVADTSCAGDGLRPISIEVPFDACGTTTTETSSAITYTNHLLYTDQSGHKTKLQTITCSFPRKVKLSQKVMSVPHSVNSGGNVSVTMDVYKDPQLKKKFKRVMFKANEFLYIKLTHSGTDGSLSIFPQECHSMSSLDSTNSSLQLISEGCPVAERAKLVASPSNETIVVVKTATLKDSSTDQIYIVCTVTVCQKKDKCSPNCPSVASNVTSGTNLFKVLGILYVLQYVYSS